MQQSEPRKHLSMNFSVSKQKRTSNRKGSGFGQYISLVAALAISTTSVVANQDSADNDVTNGCGAYAVLSEMWEHHKGVAQKLLKINNDNENRRRIYTIAAEAARDATARCLLSSVAADAAAKQDAMISAVEAARKTHTDGLLALKDFLIDAAQAAALEKIQFTAATSPGKKLSDSSVAYRLHVTGGQGNTCAQADTDGIRKIATKKIKLSNHRKLKAMKTSTLAKALYTPVIKYTVGATCTDPGTAWKNWATATGGCGTEAPGNNSPSHYAAAEPTGTAELAELSIYSGDETTSPCADSNAITGTGDNDIKVKANAVCKASKIQPPSVELTPLTGGSLSESPAVQAVAKACLPAIMKKSKMEPRDVENLKNFLKTAYGESESAFQTKFKHLVEEAEVQVYRDGEVISVKINTITTPVEEKDASSRLMAKQEAAKLESGQNPTTADQKESGDKTGEKKEGDNKATGVNCSSHSTSDACTKGQNCKWENNA
uniref:Variant surface glycoprotein n=1 Tax=Trypanosoma brucei TaxID=5691 RepID=A0A1V0FYB6_9TRYP|nr:variant surface glycoprotein [Trypanosoma brucei]